VFEGSHSFGVGDACFEYGDRRFWVPKAVFDPKTTKAVFPWRWPQDTLCTVLAKHEAIASDARKRLEAIRRVSHMLDDSSTLRAYKAFASMVAWPAGVLQKVT
jgi:hypothetical protein